MPLETKKIEKRVIGPIPPRDPHGRLLISPLMGKRVRLNSLKEPVRDERGQPVEETVDLRDPREYSTWQPGMVPAEGSTKGLKLFQVDYDIEPFCQVFATDADDALRVWRKEMGIQRLNSFDDPKVTQVAQQ
jgi:hypothetical protein